MIFQSAIRLDNLQLCELGRVSPPLLSIDPQRAFATLCGCTAVLLGCYVTTVAARLLTQHQSLFGLARLLDLDEEANVPRFFSLLQLALKTSPVYLTEVFFEEGMQMFGITLFI